jgi:hypothetical protein
MGQVALLPDASGWRNVAQPFVVQNILLLTEVRRMRRRADAFCPKLLWLKLDRGCIGT